MNSFEHFHGQQHRMPGQRHASNASLWSGDFIRITLLNLLILSGGNMLIPTFPFYIKFLGGTEMTVGVAAACYSLSALLMRPLAGWFLDRKGRKGIFYVGVIGITLIGAGYNFIALLPFLILLRVMHGFLFAAASTSAITCAADLVPPNRFAEGMGWFGLSNSLAMAIAPALGQWVMVRFGFTWMFYCCAAFGVLSLLLMFGLSVQEPTRAIYIPHRKKMPGEVLHRMVSPEAFPSAFVMLPVMIPGGAISSFIALYAAAEQMGNAALYFLLQAVVTGLVRILCAKSVDKWGEGPPIYISNAAFLLALSFLVFGHQPTLFYLTAVLYGVGYGLSLPAYQTFAIRCAAPDHRGAASSTYLCSFDISWALGGLLGGVLVTAFGYRAMFAIVSAGILLGAVLYVRWARFTPAAFHKEPCPVKD